MKKNLFILLVLVGAYSSVNAQTGEIVVGGGLSFNSETEKTTVDGNTSESDPHVTFEFSPRAGYFVADDLEVGLRLGYSSSKIGDTDGKIVTSSLYIGPYVRKYFELADNIHAFGQGAISIGSGKTKSTGGGTTVKTDNFSSFSIGVTPGVEYRASDRIALEIGLGFLGYSSYTNENYGGADDEHQTNDLTLRVDLSSLNFGVNVYL